jgi:hypothetical protein
MKTSILKISEIEVIPIKPKKRIIGLASFALDKKYYVNSVPICNQLNGLGLLDTLSFDLIYVNPPILASSEVTSTFALTFPTNLLVNSVEELYFTSFFYKYEKKEF